MILLILRRGARRLLGPACGGPGVTVLEPAGLSAPGWAHDPDQPGEDRLVTDGVICPARRLTAVITALDAVEPRDLPHVVAGDRCFVAAEMTAFLRSWLRTLACPVLDRPTALALSGSAGDRAVWSRAAAELAIPDWQAAVAARTRMTGVTVIAGQVIGPAPEQAATAALSLTRAAGVTAAELTFTDDGQLSEAAPWWHRPTPAALRALLARAREARMNAVLLWGLPTDEPLAAVHHALRALGAEVIMVNQRRALSSHVLHGPDGPVLRQRDRTRPLGEVAAAYPRPYPCPPPRSCPARPVALRHVARLEHELWHWTATTSATVVNRPGPGASNSTKPAQTQVAKTCGFRVPDSLLTNDPEQVRAFAARHGRVIYKAAGAERTITGQLDVTDARRLERLSTCPVYFQRYIAGTNVRVNVAGTEVYATEVTSDAVDYRRHIQGMAPAALPGRIADACRAVTQALGLLLSGIDLIRAPDGEWYFLEANTSPGFTFYPDRDQVAASIARLLVRPPTSLLAHAGLPGIAHRHDTAPGAVALR